MILVSRGSKSTRACAYVRCWLSALNISVDGDTSEVGQHRLRDNQDTGHKCKVCTAVLQHLLSVYDLVFLLILSIISRDVTLTTDCVI